MKASLLRGSVVRSSRARRSCGEAVAGAGGRVAHTLASVAWPSRLAKPRVHALGAVAAVTTLHTFFGNNAEVIITFDYSYTSPRLGNN